MKQRYNCLLLSLSVVVGATTLLTDTTQALTFRIGRQSDELPISVTLGRQFLKNPLGVRENP